MNLSAADATGGTVKSTKASGLLGHAPGSDDFVVTGTAAEVFFLHLTSWSFSYSGKHFSAPEQTKTAPLFGLGILFLLLIQSRMSRKGLLLSSAYRC